MCEHSCSTQQFHDPDSSGPKLDFFADHNLPVLWRADIIWLRSEWVALWEGVCDKGIKTMEVGIRMSKCSTSIVQVSSHLLTQETLKQSRSSLLGALR